MSDHQKLLEWKKNPEFHHVREAFLGDFAGGDGVRFTHEFLPTCHRRGKNKLLIEVASGPGHHQWGCFDHDDQPMRWYHSEACLESEAAAIARVLWFERHGSET